MRQLNIAWLIADHVTFRHVNGMTSRGLLNHAGTRFPAPTPVIGMMRTAQDIIQPGPGPHEAGPQFCMNGLYIAERKISARKAGLIRDQNDFQPRVI